MTDRRSLYRSMRVLYNFFCPKCHKLIKTDDFPEGADFGRIMWD